MEGIADTSDELAVVKWVRVTVALLAACRSQRIMFGSLDVAAEGFVLQHLGGLTLSTCGLLSALRALLDSGEGHFLFSSTVDQMILL